MKAIRSIPISPCAAALFATALLVGLLAYAPSAKASCGYYVQVGNPAASAVMPAQAMPQHPAMPNQPCPCQGPQCRTGGSAPLTASAPPAPATQFLALLDDSTGTQRDPLAAHPVDHLSALPEAHLSLPDPPPRS